MSKRMDGIAPQRSESTLAIPAVTETISVEKIEASSLNKQKEIVPFSVNDESYETLFPEPVVTISAPPTWIWWSLLGVATLGLGFLGYNVANGKVSAWLSPASTPSTSTVKIASSPSPLALVVAPTPTSLVTTPLPTSTPATTASPSAGPTTVRIANGTSTEGAATKARATLIAAGFTVSSVGNAKNPSTNTTIYYQPGHVESAQAVAKALPKYSSSLQSSADLSAPDTILVVLGTSN